MNAANKIVRKINIHKADSFDYDGMKIHITNPHNDNNNYENCPDINDSSISFFIEYGETCIYLTGDAGYNFLTRGLHCRSNGDCHSVHRPHPLSLGDFFMDRHPA